MANKKRSKKLSGINSTNSLIPAWTVGAYIYGDYFGSPNDTDFNEDNWLSLVQQVIQGYNNNCSENPKSEINLLYLYASDLELPWSSTITPGLSNPYNNSKNYQFYLTHKDATTNKDTISSKALQQAMNFTKKTDTQICVIIDGRINNGYLQNFNDSKIFSNDNAKTLADIVLNGANGSLGISNFAQSSTNFPRINGVHFDIEPFDSTEPNQVAFYTEIGTKLAQNNQYFSIFSFPNNINQTTANMLRDNGYLIIPLYDLLDMKDTPTECSGTPETGSYKKCITSDSKYPMDASGFKIVEKNKVNQLINTYNSDVPHSLDGYSNAAQATVSQTIAFANQYKIKYKFALPATASAHEFETWSDLLFNFKPQKNSSNKPTTQFATTNSGPTIRKNANNVPQINYLTKALIAIQNGISSSQQNKNFDPSLFLGLDIYGFSFKSLWTPYPLIEDQTTGIVYAGGYYVDNQRNINPQYIYNTEVYNWNADTYYVNYLSFTPSNPTEDVLSLLSDNLGGFYTLSNGS
jgi:hypothetical protein